MTPEQWIENQILNLWTDYDEAENRSLAPPGGFSMEMENILDNILEATHIVGPANWMNIGGRMLASGTYQTLCEMWGIPYTYPTKEEYDQYVKPHWGERRN